MVGSFALDFFVFAFIASLGVLQMVAAYTALRGLLFIRVRSLAFFLGLATTALGFLWFFLSEPRNLPDSNGGLDGNQIAGLYTLGAGLALLVTLVVSSITNRSLGFGTHKLSSGLDALRETTYIRALMTSVRDIWTSYRR